MSKFDLLKQLQTKKKPVKESVTSNISYQEYEFELNKKTLTVCVPLRESENFENAIEKTMDLDIDALRDLLRDYRGFIKCAQ